MLQLLLWKKKKMCRKMQQGQVPLPRRFSIERSYSHFEWRPDEIQINVIKRRPFPISLISRLASWPIYIN